MHIEGWTQTQKHLHRLMSPNTCKVYITVLRVLKKKEKKKKKKRPKGIKNLVSAELLVCTCDCCSLFISP